MPSIPTECTIDALPRNGYITRTYFSIPMPLSVGDTIENSRRVEYKCEYGYRLQGNATRECVDGKWTPEAPTCEPKGACHIN